MKKHNFYAGPSILSEYKILRVWGYHFLRSLIEVRSL